MPNVIGATEQSLAERERRAERALGALANEVKRLATQLAEHSATVKALKDDQRGIRQKFDAIDRAVSAIPIVSKETVSTLSQSVAHVTQRLERLEAAAIGKEETKPPKRCDRHGEHRTEAKVDERRQGDREGRKPSNPLDTWF